MILRPGRYETTIRGAYARIDRRLDPTLHALVERAFERADVMPDVVSELELRVGEDVGRWVAVFELVPHPVQRLPIVVELEGPARDG